MKKRVVATGVGLITAIGTDVKTFWENVINLRSGVSPVTSFDTSLYPHHNGCEIKLPLSADILTSYERRVLGKASQFAILATEEALIDAKLKVGDETNNVGAIFGTTFGEAQILERAVELKIKEGKLGKIKNRISQYYSNSISVNVAKKFSLMGPNIVVPTACAAGNYAVAYGKLLIETGAADVVIVGGSDPFSHVAFSGFSRLGVMAETKCQPFDRNRRGMMVGEGAGVIILEDYEHAKTRGANIYAEILSVGFSCDANHMTIPDVAGVVAMMRNALAIANVNIEDVDYICAHGTGTVMNDLTESKAIKNVFYLNGNKVPVSSIKSMIGHSMGAASAIETATCLLAMKNNLIPPTANFFENDPECDIDCVPNVARQKKLKFVLNNSLAFGGNNSTVLLKKI